MHDLLGKQVSLRIEVPRGGRRKPDANGETRYWSPIGSPFNYGCVPEQLSGDGDPLDAVLLGRRVAEGTHHEATAVGWVAFVDAGEDDPKLICSHAPPTAWQKRQVYAFFVAYAVLKRARFWMPSSRVDSVTWA